MYDEAHFAFLNELTEVPNCRNPKIPRQVGTEPHLVGNPALFPLTSGHAEAQTQHVMLTIPFLHR